MKMSAPASEGVQDDDDILGFPGDGSVDKTDANPGVFGEQDEEGDSVTHESTRQVVLLHWSVSRSARKLMWFRPMGLWQIVSRN